METTIVMGYIGDYRVYIGVIYGDYGQLVQLRGPHCQDGAHVGASQPTGQGDLPLFTNLGV